MLELTRTNNPVLISWLLSRLEEKGIPAFVLDTHTSVLEGSISAIERRVMVDDSDIAGARVVLWEAAAHEKAHEEASETETP